MQAGSVEGGRWEPNTAQWWVIWTGALVCVAALNPDVLAAVLRWGDWQYYVLRHSYRSTASVLFLVAVLVWFLGQTGSRLRNRVRAVAIAAVVAATLIAVDGIEHRPAPQKTGDIFDQVAPGLTPDQFMKTQQSFSDFMATQAPGQPVTLDPAGINPHKK